MSETQPVPDDQDMSVPTPSGSCVHCKRRPALNDYPTKLCRECREHFIRFPIPLWIKLFAVAIGVVVIFASYSFPAQLTVGLHMAKGEHAEKEKRFFTARKEFELASKHVTDNLKLNCHLFICAAHNGDMAEMGYYWSKISGKSMDDEPLISAVNEASSIADYYFPSDELAGLSKQYSAHIPDSTLNRCLDLYPDDQSIAYAFACTLYNESRYDSCSRVLSRILDRQPSNIQALDLFGYLYVLRNMPDSALYYCDEVLNFNKENFLTLSSKARNLLRLGRDQEAVAPAEQAYHLCDTSSYTVGTMTLLYHFTNQGSLETRFLNKLQTFKDTTDKSNVDYVQNILSGKEPFRAKI